MWKKNENILGKKEIEWFARWCQQCVDPFDLLANIAINGAYEFWLLLWNCIVMCTGLFIVKVALFCKCSWHHPIALAKWKSLHHCTMLQKLSKCEVKAWLCWNWIILPPLRFYVKSNLGGFKFQLPNLPKLQSSASLKLPWLTFLDCLNSPKFDFT